MGKGHDEEATSFRATGGNRLGNYSREQSWDRNKELYLLPEGGHPTTVAQEASEPLWTSNCCGLTSFPCLNRNILSDYALPGSALIFGVCGAIN